MDENKKEFESMDWDETQTSGNERLDALDTTEEIEFTEEAEFVEEAAPVKETSIFIDHIESKPHEEVVHVKKSSGWKSVLAVLVAIALVGSTTYTIGFYIGQVHLNDDLIEARINDILSTNHRSEINSAVVAYLDENGTENFAMGDGFSHIYNAVSGSVVGITSKKTYYDWFNVQRTTGGSGSGVIIDETTDKYYIVTNYHVVDGATEVVADLGDENIVDATLVGFDADTDIAVLAIMKDAVSDLLENDIKPIIVGDSDALNVGEPAIAIGNPLGYNDTLTAGYVSAVERNVNNDQNIKYIQTDAAINPGNSGGALVNRKGELIGINTAKIADTQVEGMGFAIPTNTLMPIVNAIIKEGYVARPYIGIAGINIDEDDSELYEIPMGVMVREVFSGSPAEKAGLKPADLIIGINEEKVFNMDDLIRIISNMNPGDTIELKVLRGGTEKLSLNVVLGRKGPSN